MTKRSSENKNRNLSAQNFRKITLNNDKEIIVTKNQHPDNMETNTTLKRRISTT